MYGDFDDCATSTAHAGDVLAWLQQYRLPGSKPFPKIGLRLCPKNDQAHARGAQLIVTVDNGIHAGRTRLSAGSGYCYDHRRYRRHITAAEAINPDRAIVISSKSPAGGGCSRWRCAPFCAIRAGLIWHRNSNPAELLIWEGDSADVAGR